MAMSDLELEEGNTAEKQTDLVATPHDLGPDHLMDFVGKHILEIKPGTTLLASDGVNKNNFGGVFARGVGTGFGVHGVSSRGHGVRGDGAVGVAGTTNVTGNGAVYGAHQGTDGFGVVGDAGGSNAAGVLGRNTSGSGMACGARARSASPAPQA